MNSVVSSGVFNTMFLLLLLIAPLVFLLVWFFVNRISVRANEQIALLETLVERQQQQNALLSQLCHALAPPAPASEDDPQLSRDDDPLGQMVAER